MSSLANLRGMLMEEAVLKVLERAGYAVVDSPAGDPSLEVTRTGMYVSGRGARHQIDAIAQHVVRMPFSNPQRLLVEAKCLKAGERVRLPVLRGAFATLSDVSEYWMPLREPGSQPERPRYHYQYAVASATGFSDEAQKFAYAHDIYLIDLSHDLAFQAAITQARNLSESQLNLEQMSKEPGSLYKMRMWVRSNLLGEEAANAESTAEVSDAAKTALQPFVNAARRLDNVYVGHAKGAMPILLTLTKDYRIDDVQPDALFRLQRDEELWQLILGGQAVFTFKLPDVYAALFADSTSSLQAKSDILGDIQILVTEPGGKAIRVISLRLDSGWLNALRERLSRRRNSEQRE